VDIVVKLAFQEQAALRLLNWLARENARIFLSYDKRARTKGEKPLPGLYESGVRYEVEKGEIWCDYLNLLMEGHEDCDALAAARAGELLARGWRAMRPADPRDPVKYPGDQGYAAAMRLRPRSIRAEVMLSTGGKPGEPSLYHCITRYWIGGREYRDDPSARLGMLTGNSAEERAGIAGVAVSEVYNGILGHKRAMFGGDLWWASALDTGLDLGPRSRASYFGAMGKGPYPFAARAAMYARYDVTALHHARLDARAARDTADRNAKAMGERYGWNSAAAQEWRSNYGWYADDVHTILKEIRKRHRGTGFGAVLVRLREQRESGVAA